MRVAARLWLGAAPRPDAQRPRCSCGAAVDCAGRQFLAACPAQVGRRTDVHDHIASMVAAAQRRAPKWTAVAVDWRLPGAGAAQRPDLRAIEGTTAAITCGVVSVAWPWADSVAAY